MTTNILKIFFTIYSYVILKTYTNLSIDFPLKKVLIENKEK